jgi:hypothetical protein
MMRRRYRTWQSIDTDGGHGSRDTAEHYTQHWRRRRPSAAMTTHGGGYAVSNLAFCISRSDADVAVVVDDDD